MLQFPSISVNFLSCFNSAFKCLQDFSRLQIERTYMDILCIAAYCSISQVLLFVDQELAKTGEEKHPSVKKENFVTLVSHIICELVIIYSIAHEHFVAAFHTTSHFVLQILDDAYDIAILEGFLAHELCNVF